MKLGAKIWIRGDEQARFDQLEKKMGFFEEDGTPVTMYQFDRIGHDGEVVETYIQNKEYVDL